jgi:acetoin utilization deacetylase AcuC-like enzyme
MPCTFLYHAAYRRGLSGVPMDAMRGERVLTWLLDEGWIGRRQVVAPRPASVEQLLGAHSAAWLRALEDPAEVGRVMGLTLSPEAAAAAVAVQRLAAGGTTQAARRALRNNGVAFHLGGGFHHAGPERGGGFCLLNDVAVAVHRLRVRGFSAPILVVDLDVHDGNGTRAHFADDPTVWTYSLHNRHWEEPAAVADTSLEFGPGVEDGPYMELLSRTLPPVVEAHRPGLVIYVAGVDPAADDGYGDGRLTRAGILERDRFVTTLARESSGPRRAPTPLVVVLAGGYGSSAWRASARYAAWLVTGRIEEPPDDVVVALDRAQRHWKGADSHADEDGPETSAPDDPFAWSLEPGDLAAVGGAPTEIPRFLDRWDAPALREGLERFGILAQLRNRGYARPHVELGGGSGLGPVLRVWGEAERRHLLVELRAELDRATLPGTPLLRVEWLLLQDPRARFTASRPPLPGQSHPGLGGLADVVAWLVTLGRELEVAGIVFRTGHWHVAVLARRHLHFLSAEDAEHFDAVARSVQGRPLAQAAAELEARGRDRGAPPWGDVAMVIPVGDALEGRTFAPSADTLGANA